MFMCSGGHPPQGIREIEECIYVCNRCGHILVAKECGTCGVLQIHGLHPNFCSAWRLRIPRPHFELRLPFVQMLAARCTRCNFMRRTDPLAHCPDHMATTMITVAGSHDSASQIFRKAVLDNEAVYQSWDENR